MGEVFLGYERAIVGIGGDGGYSAVDLWNFPVCIHGVSDGIGEIHLLAMIFYLLLRF